MTHLSISHNGQFLQMCMDGNSFPSLCVGSYIIDYFMCYKFTLPLNHQRCKLHEDMDLAHPTDWYIFDV